MFLVQEACIIHMGKVHCSCISKFDGNQNRTVKANKHLVILHYLTKKT